METRLRPYFRREARQITIKSSSLIPWVRCCVLTLDHRVALAVPPRRSLECSSSILLWERKNRSIMWS